MGGVERCGGDARDDSRWGPSGAADAQLGGVREIPGEEAHLQLASHTHGAQVRVFPDVRNSWLDIVRSGEVAADGWAADSIGEPPNRIYIDQGIGFSTVPVRINCRPELTQIALRQPTGRVPRRGTGEVEVTDS